MTRQKQLCELTLYESVKRSAERFPGRTALVYQGKRIRYDTLLSRIDRLAAGLYARGVRKGDVVTICMPNIPESVYALYAVNRLGAVAHMVHPLAPPARLAEYVTETGSKLVLPRNPAAAEPSRNRVRSRGQPRYSQARGIPSPASG